MKTLKKDWLIWIIILVPFLFVGWFWKQFPDQIATHFGTDGKPNDYSSKVVGLILLPSMNILFYFLFIVLPKIDPRKKNYDMFADKFKIIRYAIHAFMSFVFMGTILFSLGYNVKIDILVIYGILVLFLILGNVMGNVRPNFFVGIRTPWTLSSEQVWIKTHRLTAKIWVGGTLFMMIVYPFVPFREIVFAIYVGIISIVPIIYSFILYKRTTKNEN